MPQVKLRGAVLLKVVSIIFIILGALSVASGFLSPLSGRTLVNTLGIDEIAIQYFQILGVTSIVTGAVMLICGLCGLRLCNNPGKINFLIILGIINIVVTAFSTLYNYIMAPVGERVLEEMQKAVMEMGSGVAGNMNIGGMMQSAPLMAVGFILPVLFIVGALLNKLPPRKTTVAPYTQPNPQSDSPYSQNYVAPEEKQQDNKE